MGMTSTQQHGVAWRCCCCIYSVGADSTTHTCYFSFLQETLLSNITTDYRVHQYNNYRWYRTISLALIHWLYSICLVTSQNFTLSIHLHLHDQNLFYLINVLRSSIQIHSYCIKNWTNLYWWRLTQIYASG